jgi:site-specific DNA-methyltransferase (adenine-specific)
MNQLILGDNLAILKQQDSNSMDLIYLDPPFFSNRSYEVIWGDAGEIRSFQDRWSGGIDHYIAWLKERVEEMHRILKPTGSLFLHCDWHANAYIRVLILDRVFGEQNFNSEIIWERTFGSGSSKTISKKFPTNTDTIWFYNKSSRFVFNQIWKPYEEATLKRYDKIDEHGRRYKWENLKTYSKERLDNLLSKGEAKFSDQSKYPVYKRYLDEGKGTPVTNLWNDIPFIGTKSPERIGYPTQKPEALLERIILCASNEGDLVLDPFVGGGTTVAVADRLKRQWLGIDQSVQAIKVSEMRLQKQQDLFSKPFVVKLHKYDYETLRDSNAFEFQNWIIQQAGGVPNTKQRGDLGIDGRSREGFPMQVKRSEGVGRNVIDNFKSACERFDRSLFDRNKASKLPIGVIIAFSFNKGAIQEVARLKNEENLLIQLLKVEDIVSIAKKPKLNVKFTDLGLDSKGLREIEFIAQGESDAGIELYAWDFSHDKQAGFKADVMMDKEGKQREKFKTGSHVIAVKVVDNEGLESVEVIELKVNGTIDAI